jgi:hypothetical protein
MMSETGNRRDEGGRLSKFGGDAERLPRRGNLLTLERLDDPPHHRRQGMSGQSDWQKAQGTACSCGGADEWCPCQNVQRLAKPLPPPAVTDEMVERASDKYAEVSGQAVLFKDMRLALLAALQPPSKEG